MSTDDCYLVLLAVEQLVDALLDPTLLVFMLNDVADRRRRSDHKKNRNAKNTNCKCKI